MVLTTDRLGVYWFFCNPVTGHGYVARRRRDTASEDALSAHELMVDALCRHIWEENLEKLKALGQRQSQHAS
jgi:hypothetical protein